MKPSQAIVRLIEAGYSETQIAQAAGASQSTINRIKHGAPSNFELGQALIKLARRARAQRGPNAQEVA